MRAQRVRQAANYKRPDEINLGYRPCTILSKESRMFLYPRDSGLKQVGKEKREQQDEEGAARHIDNNHREHEERHGGDYIPSTVVK